MANGTPRSARQATLLGLAIAVMLLAGGDVTAQAPRDGSDERHSGSANLEPYVISALLLPSQTALLKSKHDEQVLETPFRVGDSVETGQLLIRLMDAEEQVRKDRAETLLEEARRDLERIQKLHAQGSVSEEALQDAETDFHLAEADFEITRILLEEHSVHAPFDGVVASLYVDPGTSVEIGDPLVRISALTPLWLEALLPEDLLPVVENGARIRVTVSHPDTTLLLPVEMATIVVDPASGTFPLRIEVDNSQLRLIPGVSCQIVLNGSGKRAP